MVSFFLCPSNLLHPFLLSVSKFTSCSFSVFTFCIKICSELFNLCKETELSNGTSTQAYVHCTHQDRRHWSGWYGCNQTSFQGSTRKKHLIQGKNVWSCCHLNSNYLDDFLDVRKTFAEVVTFGDASVHDF